MLPIDCSKIIVDFIQGDISVHEFEQWIYSNEELEENLSNEKYSELISLNFADKGIRYSVDALLDDLIDYGSLHKEQILKILEDWINHTQNPIDILTKLYNFAEQGYYFLSENDLIGNFGEQGKSVIHIMDRTLSEQEQRKIIEGSYGGFTNFINQIKSKLKEGKIVLTGKKKKVEFYGTIYLYVEK